MKNIILLTAPPRTGKSTLIKKIIEQMGENNFCGFFTEEIRWNGDRVGFKLREIGGEEFILAHAGMVSDFKIGRYYVDLDKFEDFVAKFFSNIKEDKILVIDEIGPMQLLSNFFKKRIVKLFNKPIAVLGTAFFEELEWLSEVKKSDKIDVINVTLENRDTITEEVVDKLKNITHAIEELKPELAQKEIKSETYVKLFRDKTKNVNNEIVIESTNGIRIIVDDPTLGMSCTCDFYKKANTCSHIMAFKKALKKGIVK